MGNNVRHDLRIQGEALARMAAGTPAKAVARDLSVPYSTVRRWRDANASLVNARPDLRAVHEEIANLLTEYLRESLRTAIELAKFMRTERWLMQQSADDLGTMYGINVDKAFRLAAAMRPIDESPAVIDSEVRHADE